MANYSINSISTSCGQTSCPKSTQAIIDNDRLDRHTLIRRLSGNSLLTEQSTSAGIAWPVQRPRKRGASTSICPLTGQESSPWVTVPPYGDQTLNKTNAEAMPSDIVVDSGGDPQSLSLCEPSSLVSGSTSLTTRLPTSPRDASPLLPARCSHVSKPSKKLEKVRQQVQHHRKAQNESLYEDLVQDYGVDREEHPVRRRLSTSVSPASHTTLPTPSRHRLRSKSTSTYQASTNNTSIILRSSPLLGPINLPSPSSAQALCLAAIADFEKTQTRLMEAWSRCCKFALAKSLPPIQKLWNHLHNLIFVIHLFTALRRNWLHPDARADYMTWRTPAQKHIHRSMNIADEEEDDDDDDNARQRYPLSATQLVRLARVCFKASDMLCPLIKALKALREWQVSMMRSNIMAGRDSRRCWREGQRRMDECVVYITRCRLVSWLRSAKDEACAALGLDASRVLGDEGEGDLEMVHGALSAERDVEDTQEDEKDDDDELLEQVKVPRQLRLLIVTLKIRYHLFCLLSPRCSFDKLEELATTITLLLQQLEGGMMGNTAALCTKLSALRRRVMKRLEKAEKAHPRTITLLDSATRKIMTTTTRPTTTNGPVDLSKRIFSGIKVVCGKVWEASILDDVDELIKRCQKARGKKRLSTSEEKALRMAFRGL